MKTQIFYFLLFFAITSMSLITENEECTSILDLVAKDDVAATSPTESVIVNVLENDIGEGIFVKGITNSPRCGEAEIIDPTMGTIRFTPDAYCFLTAITFDYQIEDMDGNIAESSIHIVLYEGEKELIVDVRRDCSPSDETGTYNVNVIVAGGTPPFTISGSINETLEETGFRTASFTDGLPYEITITDAAGNTFSKGDEISCTTLGPSIEILRMDEIADCICQGDLLIRSENFIDGEKVIGVDGFWLGSGDGKAIQLGDTIPHYADFWIHEIETTESSYTIRIDNEKTLTGYTQLFCPNVSLIPPLILNESESQTLVCGEGEIVLSMEGGGEGAVYSWYLDAARTIPANPPTGQTWVNNEIIGPRIIYVQATDENGCQSEPLAISTYHYTLIEVEDLEIEVDETECEQYRVSFLIRGGNSNYTVNGTPTFERFVSDWMPIEEDYSFLVDDVNLIPHCEPITISGLASDLECFPLANDDFRTNAKGENTIVNVLKNDTGKDIQLTSILTTPQCGQIVDANLEMGTITYQGNFNSECEKEDSFTYEITDANGQTSEGTVHIVFVETSSELVVEVVPDCSNQYEYGTVDLRIRILGGVPPFEVNGVIGNSSEQNHETFHHTLEDFGELVETFEFYQRYELTITDAEGSTFTRIDDFPCCYTVEVVPYLDCFIEGEDTLAILTYELIGEDGNVWMQDVQGNSQNDTLQNGELYVLVGPGGIECGVAVIQDTVDCDFTSIPNKEYPISNPEKSGQVIELFPNPNDGNFTLSLELKQAEEISIEIVDFTGRVKTRRHLQGSATFERHTFERQDLPTGLYFIRVSGKDWQWTEKMVVE